jgi:hypothetical protein
MAGKKAYGKASAIIHANDGGVAVLMLQQGRKEPNGGAYGHEQYNSLVLAECLPDDRSQGQREGFNRGFDRKADVLRIPINQVQCYVA